jgi:DNA-binding response OmpR family regulator
VKAAQDGLEAMALLQRYRPDVIVLDAMMPKMDGFAVLDALSADPALRASPVLMLTAMRNASDVKRAIDQGANDYLTKPFSTGQLLARVERLLKIAHDNAADSLVQDSSAQYLEDD